MADYLAASEDAEGAVAWARGTDDVYLDVALDGDFVRVQTYTRMCLDQSGAFRLTPGVPVVSAMGDEFAPDALGAAIRRSCNAPDGGAADPYHRERSGK